MDQSPVRLLGKLSLDEYLESHRLALRRRRNFMRGAAVAYGVVCIGVAFTQSGGQQLIVIILGLGLVTYGWFLHDMFLRSKVERNWREHPELAERTFQFTFDAEGMSSPDDRGEERRVGWDELWRFRMSADLLLLFFSPTYWLVLPWRWTEPARVADLQALVRERVRGR